MLDVWNKKDETFQRTLKTNIHKKKKEDVICLIKFDVFFLKLLPDNITIKEKLKDSFKKKELEWTNEIYDNARIPLIFVTHQMLLHLNGIYCYTHTTLQIWHLQIISSVLVCKNFCRRQNFYFKSGQIIHVKKDFDPFLCRRDQKLYECGIMELPER